MPVFSQSHIKPNAPLFQRRGARVKVNITLPKLMVDQLKKEGKKPPFYQGEALVDTGASISAVDQKVFGKLLIQPIGVTLVRTPTRSEQQNIYPVSFVFPELKLVVQSAGVIGSNLLNQGIVALIGRDLLTRFVFIYNGPAGSFTLAF